MKTIALLFLLALMGCDSEPTTIIMGYWGGTMYLCQRPYPIEFYICQADNEIGGYFVSPLGNGLIELSDSSTIISNRMVIVANDTINARKYIFSGTMYEDKIYGEYKLVLYNETYEDFWNAHKTN
jgi:hypothetical protein